MLAVTPDDAMDIPATLWKRRWLIVLLVVVATLGALAASLIQDKTYVSSVKVWVKPTAINPPGSIPQTSTVDLATEAELVTSTPVADAAQAQTDGVAISRANVSVTVPPEGQVLTISYSAGAAESAREGAQAFAQGYLDFRMQQATEQIDGAIAKAQEQMTGLQDQAADLSKKLAAEAPGSTAAIALQNDLAQINGQIAIWKNTSSILNVSAVDAGSIIVPAAVPTSSSAPDPMSDAARGALAGLVLGILVVLLSESARRAKARTA